MPLLLGLCIGCVQEEVPVPDPTPSPEKEMITLYFRDASRPATRALNDSLESVVETVDLLIFKYTNSQPLFAERISVNKSDIHTVADDYTKKEFTFTIDRTKDYYQVVLLANARKEVDAYMNGNPHIGELKSAFSTGIVSENQNLWNTTFGSQDFSYIPMWGESAGAKTIAQLNENEIKLYRSLARVDVKVDAGVLFTLNAIYVYNRPLRGRIVPDPDTWDEAQNRFTSPSLPVNWEVINPAGSKPSGPYYTVTGNSSTHEIYLYETKEQTTQDFMKATALVLAGLYNNKTNYYRVDFAKIPDQLSNPTLPSDWWEQLPPTSGEGEGGMVGAGDIYHPLIRNHHYEIAITGVRGPGYDTAEEASKSVSTQLSFELFTWDNQNQNIIIDNESHTLEITPSIVTISQTQSREITFSTSYPNPLWRVSEPSVDWFECSLQGNDNKIRVAYKASTALPPKGSEGYFRLQLIGGNTLKVSQQIKVVFN
jgi:hypothetical protein